MNRAEQLKGLLLTEATPSRLTEIIGDATYGHRRIVDIPTQEIKNLREDMKEKDSTFFKVLFAELYRRKMIEQSMANDLDNFNAYHFDPDKYTQWNAIHYDALIDTDNNMNVDFVNRLALEGAFDEDYID